MSVEKYIIKINNLLINKDVIAFATSSCDHKEDIQQYLELCFVNRITWRVEYHLSFSLHIIIIIIIIIIYLFRLKCFALKPRWIKNKPIKMKCTGACQKNYNIMKKFIIFPYYSKSKTCAMHPFTQQTATFPLLINFNLEDFKVVIILDTVCRHQVPLENENLRIHKIGQQQEAWRRRKFAFIIKHDFGPLSSGSGLFSLVSRFWGS